jgi:hypothetical protein
MKRKVSITSSALVHDIEQLRKAAPSELKERWRTLCGSEPPRRISRDLLVGALAYRLQEQALGRLKSSTRRLLAKVAADVSAHRSIQIAPEADLKPVTVLLREWHGTQHQVIFREDGIVFNEEGLEQNFNSLHPQREACEAFIKSQASEGWKLVRTAYDDGGLSGGTMERPALKRLLADIGEGLIDVIVVYKVDRLTRSLADFAKMVELFDARGVFSLPSPSSSTPPPR